MNNQWDEFAEMWDDLASEYSDKAFAELSAVTNISNKRVFDFGCGTGLLSERICRDASEIVALDNSEKMTELFRKKSLPNVTVLTDLLTKEFLQNSSELQRGFDLIVASSVCGFLPNYHETAELLNSMLNTGGVFVQWDWQKSDSHGDNGFTKEEVQNTLSAVGFKEITLTTPFEIEGPDGVMPVLMAVSTKE